MAKPETGALSESCRFLNNYRGAQEREGMQKSCTARFGVHQHCTCIGHMGGSHHLCSKTEKS